MIKVGDKVLTGQNGLTAKGVVSSEDFGTFWVEFENGECDLRQEQDLSVYTDEEIADEKVRKSHERHERLMSRMKGI